MKKLIKKIIYNLPIHLKKYIILESNPDLSDNTYSLYKTLLENRVNEKYRIFWFVNDRSLYKNISTKNVYFINAFGKLNFLAKFKKKYINYKAKYIIDCNKLVYKKNINQKRLYLGHGMPYKKVLEYCKLIGNVDYFLSLSPFFDDILSEFTGIDRNKFIDLGFPRNDDLFCKNKSITNLFKDKSYKKVILWLPTYRQRENKTSNLNMKNTFNLGIPIIYDIASLKDLNDSLKNLNIFKTTSCSRFICNKN